MAIPLELRAFVTAQGLETFNQIQGGIAQISEAARLSASTGLRSLSDSLKRFLPLGEDVGLAFGAAVSAMNNMASNAAPLTSASLAELAMAFEKVRVMYLQSLPEYEDLTRVGLKYSTIISKLSTDHQELIGAISGAAHQIRQLSLEMKETEKEARALERGEKKLAVATRFAGKSAYLSAWTGMNVLASATQGVMMAMGALRGNLMSVGFGLVFLRYSVAPVTLAIAGLLTAVGGTLKAISFVGPAFERLIVGPMNRVKASVVEAMGYFSGAVWVRIIAPSLQVLADLAERFREVALETWLSAEVQRNWAELLGTAQGLFENLSSTIKEHGGILRWVVRTGFITAINVLKGLVYLLNIAITVLPKVAYFWRQISSELKRAWSMLGLVSQGLKSLGLERVLQRIKEFALDITLEQMMVLAAAAVKGGLKGALIAAVALMLGDVLAEFMGFDKEVRKQWDSTWAFVAAGGVLGWQIGGPEGAVVGASLGAILGTFANFRDRIATLIFEISMLLTRNLVEPFQRMLVDMDNSFRRVFGRGLLPDAYKASLVESLKYIEELDTVYREWASRGKPELKGIMDWTGTLDDLNMIMRENIKGWRSIRHTFPGAKGWLPMITREYAPPGGGGGGGGGAGVGGLPTWFNPSGVAQSVVNVTVTGNNMYGKLDEETARVWAQQLGFHTMSRLANRRGIGIR